MDFETWFGIIMFAPIVTIWAWLIVDQLRERARKRRYFERLVLAATQDRGDLSLLHLGLETLPRQQVTIAGITWKWLHHESDGDGGTVTTTLGAAEDNEVRVWREDRLVRESAPIRLKQGDREAKCTTELGRLRAEAHIRFASPAMKPMTVTCKVVEARGQAPWAYLPPQKLVTRKA